MPAASPGPRHPALLQILQTAEAIWNASRVFFEQWNLSPSQFNVLNLLRQQPDGCSQIELSRSLIMHRSNVTGLVDRLEKRGLVVRRSNPHDRRIHIVSISPAGQKLMRRVLPHYYQAADQIWTDVPVARAKQLARELQRLHASAELFFSRKP